jgi:hypothetical protein
MLYSQSYSKVLQNKLQINKLVFFKILDIKKCVLFQWIKKYKNIWKVQNYD